jgi:hypothetical protein
MDDTTIEAFSNTAVPRDMPPGAKAAHLTCDICRRRLGKNIFFVEETGDVPDEKRAWRLCGECDEAVHAQLVDSPVRTPLRLRVAVGLVAAERTPEARRSNFGQLTDESWAKFFFWLFPIAMIIHLMVIVAIAGWFK